MNLLARNGLKSRGSSWLDAILILGGVALVCALLFPAGPNCKESWERALAKNDVQNLAAALKAFCTEYGRFPSIRSDGVYADEVSQAALIRALQGRDTENNPRKVVFFEGKLANSSGGWITVKRYRAGFSPSTGALLDAWGNPYRIAVDADANGQVKSPFSDEEPIKTTVVAWSLGDDGKQSERSTKSDGERADDVVSWR